MITLLPQAYAADDDTIVEIRKVLLTTDPNISGKNKVNIVAGEEPFISVSAPSSIISKVMTENKDGTLNIYEKNVEIQKNQVPTITIHLQSLNKISVSGETTVTLDHIVSDAFAIDASGKSKLTLAGKATIHNIQTSGNTIVDATNLLVDETTLVSSGQLNLKINTKNNFNIDLTGYGEIVYLGNPKIGQHVTGALNISKASG